MSASKQSSPKKVSRDDLYSQGLAFLKKQDYLAALQSWSSLYDDASEEFKQQIAILTRHVLDYYETLEHCDSKAVPDNNALIRLSKRLEWGHPTFVRLFNDNVDKLWSSRDFETLLKIFSPSKSTWDLDIFLNYVKTFYRVRTPNQCDAFTFGGQFLTASASYCLQRKELAAPKMLLGVLMQELFQWMSDHPSYEEYKKILSQEQNVLDGMLEAILEKKISDPPFKTLVSPTHFQKLSEQNALRAKFSAWLGINKDAMPTVGSYYEPEGYSWFLFQHDYWDIPALEKDRRSKQPQTFWNLPNIDLEMAILGLKTNHSRGTYYLQKWKKENEEIPTHLLKTLEDQCPLDAIVSAPKKTLWEQLLVQLPTNAMTPKLLNLKSVVALARFWQEAPFALGNTAHLENFLIETQQLLQDSTIKMKINGSIQRVRKIEDLFKNGYASSFKKLKKARTKDDAVWDWFLTIAYAFSWFKDSFDEDRILEMTENYFDTPAIKRLLPGHLKVEERALDCGCHDCCKSIVGHFQRIGGDPNIQERTKNEMPLRLVNRQDWEQIINLGNS
ncbi:MAG: hypothetical protein HYW48_10955 [Deltaproteobacteria bacterium]|nr:hypothetical protein [Deltaproteobacteria bacterium]